MIDYYENRPNMGKNRVCLTGEQYPPLYTDVYFKKRGLDSKFETIMLGFLYIKENPKLKKTLFYNILKTISYNIKSKINKPISNKQYGIIYDFIMRDLKTRELNFPHYEIVTECMELIFVIQKGQCTHKQLSKLLDEYLI